MFRLFFVCNGCQRDGVSPSGASFARHGGLGYPLRGGRCFLRSHFFFERKKETGPPPKEKRERLRGAPAPFCPIHCNCVPLTHKLPYTAQKVSRDNAVERREYYNGLRWLPSWKARTRRRRVHSRRNLQSKSRLAAASLLLPPEKPVGFSGDPMGASAVQSFNVGLWAF